jgi:hypothetical protein
MLDFKSITKEEFEKILINSNSKSDLCRALKLSINGANMKKIKKLLDKFNLSIEHFNSNINKRKYERVICICHCGKEYEKAIGSKNKDFKSCSRECNNKYLMSGNSHPMWREKLNCIICGKKLKNHVAKFCSRECSYYHRKLYNFKKIEDGTFKSNISGTSKNKILKLYLIDKNGHKCMVCGLHDWMGNKIPLQLDHIDGDSENDKVSNIRNICPNCHAQTPTYCGKNIGNGKRKNRLNDYHSGKGNW